MKTRLYIYLMLLIGLVPMQLTPLRAQQYIDPNATPMLANEPAQMYNTTTTTTFRSTAVPMGGYNVVFAAQDLSTVGVGVQRKPPVIGKDEDAPDTPGLPVGDGTWVLLSFAALYAVLLTIRRRLNTRSDA